MEDYKKKANEDFFNQVINMIKDGGVYTWPAEVEMFIVKDGLLVGSKKAINKVKAITPSSFWDKLKQAK